MAIKPRKTQKERQQVDPSVIDFLFYGEAEPGTEAEKLNRSRFFDPDVIKRMWKTYQKELLSAWISEHPCSRPFSWWRYNAPTEPVPGWEHRHFDAPQRRRLGGVGSPSHEFLSIAPHFSYGIPESWVNQFQADYYNGRARDIHGNLIKNEYHEGHFQGVAISEEDPPTYEGQSVYLERHGLLTEAEKQWLEKHAEAREPEAVTED